MTTADDSSPRIVGYGEDSLTLWALRHDLSHILGAVGDKSIPGECELFYRPGFGRKGGVDSAEFGEFDFLILSPARFYLGESKWDRSGEVGTGELIIDHIQEVRHSVLRSYIEMWIEFQSQTPGTLQPWERFVEWAPPSIDALGVKKRIAPPGSLTAGSLAFVLDRIWERYEGRLPEVVDLVLYFHDLKNQKPPKNTTPFSLVPIGYDGSRTGYVDL
jgi:hypothetical protein